MPRKIAVSPKNTPPPGRSLRWGWTAAATLFLALAAPVLAHLLFTPKYQENDDAYMNMIACGAGICDRPDPHLLYINFLIGKLLEWFYHECPGAPWYRLFMIMSQFGASLLLYVILLHDSPTRKRFFLCLCYMLGFDVFAYANPQFTVTASMVMQAGALAYIAGLDSGRLPLGALAFLAASALSCCIRQDSYKLIFLISAPALAVAILDSLMTRRTQSRWRGCAAREVRSPDRHFLLVVYGPWSDQSGRIQVRRLGPVLRVQ